MSRELQRAYDVVEVPYNSTADLERTLVDDGAALNLSSATGPLEFFSKTRAEVAVIDAGTATWTTDGSDGRIHFPMTVAMTGELRDLICHFEVGGYQGGTLVSWAFILRPVQTGRVVT